MIRILDTNHAIALLNGDKRLGPRLTEARQAGDELAITMTVLAELYAGAYLSQRVEHNLARLADFASRVIILGFDADAAREYGRVVAEQRSKGKPIPTADAQIAAVARSQGLTLLTNDAHFELVGDIALHNWLREEQVTPPTP